VTLFENRTISLRIPEPEDLDILYLWENNPTIWQVSGTLIPFSRFILKQYLDNAGKDIFETRQLRMIIQFNQGKRPVGAIDLFDFDPAHHRAGVGILIADPSDRRKGYAKEALETLMTYGQQVLHLHQLFCNIAAKNQDSIRLFEAAGFKPVGEKKDWLYNGSGYEGEWLYQFIYPSPSVNT
jgi:diamine N-acetyltransferase